MKKSSILINHDLPKQIDPYFTLAAVFRFPFSRRSSLQKNEIQKSTKQVCSVSLSPQQNYLSAGFADGGIRIYDIRSLETFSKIGGAKEEKAKKLLPKKSYYSVEQLPQFSSNSPVIELSKEIGFTVPSLCFRPSENLEDFSDEENPVLLAVDSNGGILLYDLKKKKTVNKISYSSPLGCSDWNKSGRQFAVAGNDRKIQIFDFANFKNFQTLDKTEDEVPSISDSMVDAFGSGGLKNMKSYKIEETEKTGIGHSNRILGLKFSPADENVICSVSWDNTCQIWDLRKGKAVRYFSGIKVFGSCCVDIDQTGKRVLTTSQKKFPEGSADLWDLGTGKKIENLKIENSLSLTCGVFSRDEESKGICVGGKTNGKSCIGLFGKKLNSVVEESSGIFSNLEEENEVWALDFGRQSNLLAYGTNNGVIGILRINKVD